MAEREFPLLSSAEVNLRIRPRSAASWSWSARASAPTRTPSGIDAILNVKGHAGEKGLEYYREMRMVNLGAQVEVPDLVARARAEGADAVLVSQVVTQRDAHISNAREMAAAFRAAGPASGRCWWSAARGSTPAPRPGSAWTRSSARAPPGRGRQLPGLRPGPGRRRWRERRGRRQRKPGRRPAARADGHAPPVRALQPRPLRRQPGRRRLRARPVRRRGHRGCASGPTATRACSPPTPTSSSGPRSGPATCWRSPPR